MVQKLKEKFPRSHITVLCIPSTKEIFENSPAVDAIVVYDKKGRQKSWTEFFKLAKRIRGEKYARVYSPHRSPRSTVLSFFSSAKKTVGFDNAGLSFLYDVRKKYFKNIHEVARNLYLIGSSIENDEWRIRPVLSTTEIVKEKIQRILREFTHKKLIAVAPGSVWNTKRYPQEYFVEIIKFLLMQNYEVMILGGKEDESLCSEIESNFKSSVKSFAGKLTIVESIELLKSVDLLISNDSAPTHMAMAADVPVLTIYCSTVASFGFYPYNKRSQVISYDELDCKPCGIHGYDSCPIKSFDCAFKLSPRLVIDKVVQMITP